MFFVFCFFFFSSRRRHTRCETVTGVQTCALPIYTTGAVDAFKRAIVLDERDVWSMNNLASASITQHKYADALGPLARAIEIDSTVATFHNNLGFALEKGGYITQAVDEYRAALAIDPTYQKASRNLARVECV